MKIFLVGEGPTDCGRKLYDEKKCEYTWLDGPVQIYIHKVHSDAEIVAIDKPTFLEEAKKRKGKRGRKIQGLSGHGPNASIVAEMAMERGFDVAAMYVDADKESGSAPKSKSECQKWYAQVCDNVKKGLQKGGAKQYLAIVPMKMIECWLMGDPDAFRDAFGKTVDLLALPKEPELLWGDKHDPDSDYPKNRLKKVLERCGVEACEENYNRIAEFSQLDILSKKGCPISFGDFMDQLDGIT